MTSFWVRNKHNTPGIIKYPFWQKTNQNPNAVYACVNYGEAAAPKLRGGCGTGTDCGAVGLRGWGYWGGIEKIKVKSWTISIV